QVAAIAPTHVRKRSLERKDARPHHAIVFLKRHEQADAPHAAVLLRGRRERPRRRAAERSDEFAPSKANRHPALPCEETHEGRIARYQRSVVGSGERAFGPPYDSRRTRPIAGAPCRRPGTAPRGNAPHNAGPWARSFAARAAAVPARRPCDKDARSNG